MTIGNREHTCRVCDIDFEVRFVDWVLDDGIPEVLFCPNCGLPLRDE